MAHSLDVFIAPYSTVAVDVVSDDAAIVLQSFALQVFSYCKYSPFTHTVVTVLYSTGTTRRSSTNFIVPFLHQFDPTPVIVVSRPLSIATSHHLSAFDPHPTALAALAAHFLSQLNRIPRPTPLHRLPQLCNQIRPPTLPASLHHHQSHPL